jgi:hypothetical protein
VAKKIIKSAAYAVLGVFRLWVYKSDRTTLPGSAAMLRGFPGKQNSRSLEF